MKSSTLYPRSNWRLLLSPARSGPWNMAIDEAILQAVGKNMVLPTLRLYRWDPPCLSLGYSQPAAEVDQDRLAAENWDLVRRPTGGRAILHTDELTYAVIGPKEDPRLSGGVLESYRKLAHALAQALILLGLPVKTQAKKNPQPDQQQPICFEYPSNFEITARGKKIIGSAQARKNEGVLQHGTLPLRGDLSRITRVLNFTDPQEKRTAGTELLQKGTTVESILEIEVSWEQAADAFQAAFQEHLNLNLQLQSLTEHELAAAEVLHREKYAHPDWTNRK